MMKSLAEYKCLFMRGKDKPRIRIMLPGSYINYSSLSINIIEKKLPDFYCITVKKKILLYRFIASVPVFVNSPPKFQYSNGYCRKD